MEFGILGPVAVWRDGAEVAVGPAKQRALLSVLLLHAGETMATSALVDAVWGAQPPATAVKALQVYVSQLRKLLDDGLLETRPTGYLLRVEDGAIDARRFEQLLADGRGLLAAGEAERAGEVLREALSLWRGTALADVREDPLAQNERGRLEELRLVALEHRLEADLGAGREAEAVPELEALVREHPLRERLRGLLMLGLYRTGRRADALAVMEETRAVLRDELGLDPSQALQQLEAAIREEDLSAPSLPAVATGGAPETRKTVTVLSCELVPRDRVELEGLTGVLSRCVDVAAATVARHGGTLDVLVAGEGLAVFGQPVVREDDALRAARAAVELRHRLAALALDLGIRLEVRIGLATGEVVASAGEHLVTGSVVGESRQLQECAAPGEVLLASTTYALLAHAVNAFPVPVQTARGDSTAFWLESVDPEANARPRRDDTPLVGRERELRRLRDGFAAVAGGGAGRVTIVGEPGIGKSRLARELVAVVGDDATVLVGRCPPYGEGITFWPLRELLHQAGRDESVLEGPTHEVFASVRRVLAELAGERPVIVILDDVHWAEPTLLDLVEDLAARLGLARVLLLCLARPQLVDVRPAWLHEPDSALTLEPLSRAESESLVDALGAPPAVRERIAGAAEGNPLFVEQLAAIAGEHAPGDAMPTTIRGVLHERLDRLAREHRALLERAAVAGRSFTLDAVIELTPPQEREHVHAGVLALVRAKLVRPDTTSLADGFRFHHALIRDAAYEGIPKRTRADLHQRVAAWLEAHRADDALVGFHLEQAFLFRRELGHPDEQLGIRGGEFLWTAAKEAFNRSDVPATVSLYERVRALLPADDPRVPTLLTELGSARIGQGDFIGAEAALDEATDKARQLGDRAAELHAIVERQFLRSLTAEGDAEEHAALARSLMPELELFGDELGLARAWYLTGVGHNRACRWGRYAEAMEQALVHARRADMELDVVSGLHGTLGMALLIGPMPVGEAISRLEVLEREAIGNRASRASLSARRAGLLAMQGEFEEARSLYAEAIATCEELGATLLRAALGIVGAQIELLAGDDAAAEQELRTSGNALSRFGAVGFAATRIALLADVLCSLDRLDEAAELIDATADSGRDDDLDVQVRRRSTLARIHARRGHLVDARRLAAEALMLSEDVEDPELRLTALTAAAEVAEADGRASEARQQLDEARGLMEAKGNVVMLERLDAALGQPVR